MKEIFNSKFHIILDKMKADKKTVMIIIVGFIGMLMISLSEILPEDDIGHDEAQIEAVYNNENEKQELEKIISKIKGAGNVSVMITYEGTTENIYASDISRQNKDTDSEIVENHIILDKGSTEEGLLVKTVYPRIVGIAVVCEGGGNPSLKNEITLMLKALYNISSNSISISEMKS